MGLDRRFVRQCVIQNSHTHCNLKMRTFFVKDQFIFIACRHGFIQLYDHQNGNYGTWRHFKINHNSPILFIDYLCWKHKIMNSPADEISDSIIFEKDFISCHFINYLDNGSEHQVTSNYIYSHYKNLNLNINSRYIYIRQKRAKC